MTDRQNYDRYGPSRAYRASTSIAAGAVKTRQLKFVKIARVSLHINPEPEEATPVPPGRGGEAHICSGASCYVILHCCL